MFSFHRAAVAAPFATLALTTGLMLGSAVQVSADTTPPFTCTDKSGGQAGDRGTVSAIRAAEHTGFDRLVFGFPTTNALPPFTLTMQPSSTFTEDASGRQTTLEGRAGIRVVFHNADIAPAVPGDFKFRLPEIREVKNIGNFERVVSYGVALAHPACFRAFQVSGPTRLVIDVASPSSGAPSASSTSASTHAPASAAPAGLPLQLAQTGHPADPAPRPASLPVVVAAILGAIALAAGGVALVKGPLARRSI